MKRTSSRKTSQVGKTDFTKLRAKRDRDIDVSGMPYDARDKRNVEDFFRAGKLRRPESRNG
jgi:hypothetical protein